MPPAGGAARPREEHGNRRGRRSPTIATRTPRAPAAAPARPRAGSRGAEEQGREHAARIDRSPARGIAVEGRVGGAGARAWGGAPAY